MTEEQLERLVEGLEKVEFVMKNAAMVSAMIKEGTEFDLGLSLTLSKDIGHSLMKSVAFLYYIIDELEKQ